METSEPVDDFHESTIQHQTPEPDAHASIFATAVNITLNVIGGGLLSIPIAFDQAAIVWGLILILLIGALSTMSMCFLTFSAQRARCFTYKDLLTMAHSHRAGKLFEAVLMLYTYGILVAWGRIVADAMPPVAEKLFHAHGFVAGSAFWLMVSACVFLPLSSVRSLTELKWSSAFGFAMILYLGFMLLFRFFDGTYREPDHSSLVAPDVNYAGFSIATLQAIPILSTSFSCHYNVPVFYGELQNRSPKRMLTAIGLFIGFTGPFYIIVGIVANLLFGHARLESKSAKGDIINNFRADDLALNIARLGYYIHFLCAFPLVCLACRRAMNMLLFGRALLNTRAHVIEAAGLVLSSCTIAYFVPSIDDVFAINGAAFGMSIVIIIPAYIYLRVYDKAAAQERHVDAVELLATNDSVARVHLEAEVPVGDSAMDRALDKLCREQHPVLRKMSIGAIGLGLVLSGVCLVYTVVAVATK